MHKLITLLLLTFGMAGTWGQDADYSSFMSSLSYNWQNQFPDLRYQVDQLQKTDPQKYAQLAASLGLKPGAKIDVPSQYSPEWASMFVQAADLYTPPVHTEDPTQVPTPTAASTQSGISVQLITDLSDSAASAEPTASAESAGSGEPAGSGESAGSDSVASDSVAAEGLDTDANGSTQYGNPIVGNYDGADSPIVPTGHGYSAAAILAPSLPVLLILFI